jgi:hypothetical protein
MFFISFVVVVHVAVLARVFIGFQTLQREIVGVMTRESSFLLPCLHGRELTGLARALETPAICRG